MRLAELISTATIVVCKIALFIAISDPCAAQARFADQFSGEIWNEH
jgi:hypothetical protein